MSQQSDKLRSTLEELHAQLEQVKSGDPEVRDMLRGTLREIGEALEADREAAAEPSEEKEEDGSIRERLNDAAVHFEDTHPMLSRTISGLVDMLGQMGI